jgi:acetolactate synthase I/II/III large subunit
MKVSDLVVQVLLEHDVKFVFTVPGGFSMHLNDSIGHSQLTPVYCLHESGAGFSAIGYAAYSGKLGVCIVTSGPGSTNILTAVASAWQDSIPLLVISGDAKTANIEMRQKFQLRQGGQQDVPIMEMVKPITKWATVSDLVSLVQTQIEGGIQYALTPRRGPVWLSIPLDVQGMEI